MKCPKCGFNSFDYLESCRKCGRDLKEFKEKFGLRSLVFPRREEVASVMGQGLTADAMISSAPADAATASDSPPEAAEMAASAASAQHAIKAEEEDPFDLDWSESQGEGLEFDEQESLTRNEPSSQGFDLQGGIGEDDATSPTEGPVAGKAESDLEWEDEPLPDLSFAEDDDFDTSLLDDQPEALDFDELEGDSTEQVQPEPEKGGQGKSDDDNDSLPGLHELDFDDLGSDTQEAPVAAVADDGEEQPWGEIDFDEEQAEELEPDLQDARKKAGEQKEGPSDPFDQPEPAASGPAPVAASSDPVVEEATGGKSMPVSLMARFGAFWLDLFLVTGVFLLFLVSATRLLAPLGDRTLLPSMSDLIHLSIPYYLLLFVVSFLYFTAFHFFTGQTPGKMLFGLRLERCDGSALCLSDAFLHSVGGLAALLTLGVGFLLACRDPRGRGWNDRFAGTQVVLSGEA